MMTYDDWKLATPPEPKQEIETDFKFSKMLKFWDNINFDLLEKIINLNK